MTSGGKTDKLSLIASESAIQFSGSIVRMLLFYGLTIILTRHLGPDHYGLWALSVSLQNILMLFVLLGMPKALYRFIAYYQGAGEQGKTKSLIVETLLFSFLLSIIMVIVLLIAPTSILDQVFREAGIAQLLRVIALGTPFYALLLLLSSCYIGFKRVRYQVLTEGIGWPLVQLLFALIVFMGLLGKASDVEVWTWAYVGALAVASSMSLLLFARKVWPGLSSVQRVSLEHRAIVSYAWPLTVNAALVLASGQVDLLLLGLLGSARDVGIYRVYLYFIMPLQFVITAFAQIYQPVVTELIAQKNLAEVASIFKRVARWTFQITMFLALAIFMLGKPLTQALFGEEYLVAPIALSILAGGMVLDASVGPTLMTLEAFGRSRLVLFNSLLVVALQIGFAYFLIPRLGLVGAAIARAVAVFLANYIRLFQVWLLYRLSPFTSSHVLSLFVGILVYGLGRANQAWLTNGPPILIILITFLVGALAYWGLILALGGVDQEDRRIVGGLVKRFGMKPA